MERKMQGRLLHFISVIFLMISCLPGYSQEKNLEESKSVIILDSLKKNEFLFNGEQQRPDIKLSADESVKFLQGRLQPQYWKNTRDPLRQAMGQLVFEASHPPADSANYYLQKYPYDSIKVPWDKFFNWEKIHLKVSSAEGNVAVAEMDSAKLLKTGAEPKDTTIMVLIDTLHQVGSPYKDFPFNYYEYPYQADSIAVAVKSLLDFVQARDSSVIYISGTGKEVTPVWLNSRMGKMQRFWLKNGLNDSVTIWLGATSRNTIGLYLEDGVTFRRPAGENNYTQARIQVQQIDRSRLLEVKKIAVRQQYWKYRTESSFALSQAALSNWVKGGESNIATTLDITGYADYENKALKISSNNYARIKFGLIASGNGDSKWDIRKNIDLLETNSKLNHKAFGKFDFSAILLFKTQIAKGFNYPNDSVPVSKFFNPAIITLGLGLDYKPNKTTSINFSPLSYKGTFVLDTGKTEVLPNGKKVYHIDQTKYGVPIGHRAFNEPGVSFMITNEFKPVKTVSITNRLQLFTNYIHNPQNVDIDWEMITTASLNWFTEVRLNTHLIYDDDTKTTVLDKDMKPVTLPGGAQKKTARAQFKEQLGLSFIFRF
jgi:hypothetical protein